MHNDCQTIEKCQENRLKGAEFVREGVHFFVTPCKFSKVESNLDSVVLGKSFKLIKC